MFALPEFEVIRGQSRELISLDDPAILCPDDEKEKASLIERYLRTLDVSIIKVKPGEELTRFLVKPVTSHVSDSLSIRARTQATDVDGNVDFRALAISLAIGYCTSGLVQASGVGIEENPEVVNGTQTITGTRLMELPFSLRYEIGTYIQRLSTELVPGFTSQRRR